MLSSVEFDDQFCCRYIKISDVVADGFTYHVNMRLGQRVIARETIIQATESYEMVEEYPEDKYFPSYLLLGRRGEEAFHVLFGADIEGQNVRIVTAYYPSLEEWDVDLKTRRRSR